MKTGCVLKQESQNFSYIFKFSLFSFYLYINVIKIDISELTYL